MISLKKKNQEGVALISALSMVVIITIITGIISHKIATDTKDAIHMQKSEAAQNVADEGIETVVDWMNKRNDPTNYNITGGQTTDSFMIGMTAQEFINPFINIDRKPIDQLINPFNDLFLVDNNNPEIKIMGGRINSHASDLFQH